MEDFRQQFLLESVETLENILQNLRYAESFPESFKREIFRTLHTVKGTAQTFGFSSSSHLAHELENLLAAGTNFDELFLEGIELLIKSLKQKDFEIPKSFAEKTGARLPSDAQTSDGFNSFEIPGEFISQLSTQEKNSLRSALQNGKNLFCLEVGFGLNNFADELINLREKLNASGEIIATLPSAKFSGGQIGFQILFASAAEISEIEQVAEQSAAIIIFTSTRKNYSNDAAGVLAHVVEYGKETANKYGKQIEFEVSADEIKLAPGKLKFIFDVLLHLVRNAVDHAIETTGKITINLKAEENNLRLTVADDGRGIDAEKIKAQAIRKNLIAADTILTEQEMIDLIFLPEFSTKAVVTEISGRGVGLDAVKEATDKVGGKISVKNRSEKGTVFEIFLPA